MSRTEPASAGHGALASAGGAVPASAGGAVLSSTGGAVLVIGVGHEQRGDDAAGLAVARRLAARAPAALRVLEHDGDGLDLLLAFESAARVVVVDAVVSGDAAAGTVHRWDAGREALPAAPFAATSTHALGVADAIELARTLGRLPGRVVVYGIEGQRFEPGRGPGPEVRRAVDDVAARVLAEVARPEAGAPEPAPRL
jgi:hydrogenase maturation protease